MQVEKKGMIDITCKVITENFRFKWLIGEALEEIRNQQ